jgi:ankyrin repeat protein
MKKNTEINIIDFFTKIQEDKNAIKKVDEKGESLLHKAAKSKSSFLFNYLVRQGADLNLKCNFSLTPFHIMSRYYSLELIEDIELLIKNKRLDIELESNYGSNALIFACESNLINNVNILLKNGANINHMSRDGNALHIASQNNFIDLARKLIENGIDINAISPFGKTALHYACEIHYFDMAELLVNNNADISIKDKNGKTALDIAKQPLEDDSSIELKYRDFLAKEREQVIKILTKTIN